MGRPTVFLSSAALLTGCVTAFVPQSTVTTITNPTSNNHHDTRLFSEEPNDSKAEIATTTTNENDKEEVIYYNILSEEDPKPSAVEPQQQELMDAVVSANAAVASSYNVAPINGWVPKPDYAIWGLPGAIAPLGFFDPLGFARQGLPLNDAKRLREAEVQHGRVAMLATVGYLVGEAFPSPFGITGPANDQLQQVPAPAFALLTIGIAAAELYRAKKGWVEPKFQIGSGTLWTLRDNYYPGDIGFDPLGLKPTANYDFQVMQTKELSHGRLAMIGWAGMCAQELMNHRTIGETWDFYQTYYSSSY